MGGHKDFIRDLKSAQLCRIERVTDICRGDSDGEISFLYSHPGLPEPLQVLALAQDISSYPKKPAFMVFTGSGTLGKGFDDVLEKLPPHLNGKLVDNVITTISRELTAKLDNQPSELDSTHALEVSPSDNGISDTDEYDGTVYEDEDEDDIDYYVEFLPIRGREKPKLKVGPDGLTTRLRQKHDFRAAKDAGYHIGVYGSGTDNGQLGCLFSVALEVQYLGLSEDTLEACDIQASEFLVLLMEFKHGYPTLAELCASKQTHELASFYLGKCQRPKPSLASVKRSLNLAIADNDDDERVPMATAKETDFVRLYPMESVQRFLTKDFPTLLRTRREHACSWDAAQAHVTQREKSSHLASVSSHDKKEFSNSIVREREWPPTSKRFALSGQDHALEKEEDFSLPLVAMEFALYYLTRCGQYCVNCHKRMASVFESIKPFVCTDALCIDQYFWLGLGPPIEHEVLFNPYVVDLLISFFYDAAAENTLRERCQGLHRPQGLHLKVMDKRATAIRARIDLEDNRVHHIDLKQAVETMFRKGDKVLIIVEMPTSSCRYICRVVSSNIEEFTYEIIRNETAPETEGKNKEQSFSAKIFPWRSDLDEMDNETASFALLCVAECIPSVLTMRKKLLEHPGSQLSKFLDRDAYKLLNWIVASNRSYIVQDEPITPSNGAASSSEESTSPTKVQGLSSDWMQFRFVQGSPEKEVRFLKEVVAAKPLILKKGAEVRRPTLFAWHGSPLYNWHSIIRMGLNFDQTLHGRSYGNGVYLSPSSSVSQAYAAERVGGLEYHLGGLWPNSELRITASMAICEIVNSPRKFVSANPHYVLNNIEWIQCRYLMVKTKPTSAALENPFPGRHAGSRTQEHLGYVEQQASYPLMADDSRKGKSRAVHIPLAGVPEIRRRALYSSTSNVASKKPPELKSCQGRDIDGVLEFEEGEGKRRLGNKRRQSSLSSTSRKMTNAQHGLKGPACEGAQGAIFKPKPLNDQLVPRLTPPSWQSTAHGTLAVLSREVRALEKLQAKSDPMSLGWFIDFNKVENLFQWIVQLHSFDANLPIAEDMRAMGIDSIVIELRFGANFPVSPPFVRVIAPRFIPFHEGGGGHVTAGGAICSEMLTSSGWSPALSMDKVLLEVRLRISDTERPARLDKSVENASYGVMEAMRAYRRSAAAHGWKIPDDFAGIEQWLS